jgi:hypothetical protein
MVHRVFLHAVGKTAERRTQLIFLKRLEQDWNVG